MTNQNNKLKEKLARYVAKWSKLERGIRFKKKYRELVKQIKNNV